MLTRWTKSPHTPEGARVKELAPKDAKAALSALVDRTLAGESPAIPARKEVFVSFDKWGRLFQVPSFADLLLAFPVESDNHASPRVQRGVHSDVVSKIRIGCAGPAAFDGSFSKPLVIAAPE